MRCCREINAHTSHNLVNNVEKRVEIQRKDDLSNRMNKNEESKYFHFFKRRKKLVLQCKESNGKHRGYQMKGPSAF